MSKGVRPISITSSIRSGKPEKPLRMHHNIPPPSNKQRQLYTPTSMVDSIHANETNGYTSYKASNNNNNNKTMPLSEIERILKMSDDTKLFTQGYENYRKSLKNDSKKDRVLHEFSGRKSTTHKQAPLSNNSDYLAKLKTSMKTTTGRTGGGDTNSSPDENFGGRTTNLPQLGQIDYIYRTNNDKYKSTHMHL